MRRDNDEVWRPLIGGVLALAVAMGIGRFALTPIIPAMRNAFDLTPADLGTLASANYLGYLLGTVAAAPFPVRSQGWILRCCLLTVVVTTALMAATSTLPVWLILRFLAGLASAGVFIFGSTIVLQWIGQRGRRDLTGWFFSGVGLGIASSGALILGLNHVTGSPESWRVEWLGIAALAAVLTTACWALLPGTSTAGVGPAQEPVVTSGERAWVPILLLGIAYLLAGAGYIVAGTFIVAIVAALPGVAGLAAGAWILVGLAATISTVMWSRIAGQAGPIAALVLAYILLAISLALPALSDRGTIAAISALLFGGTFMGITSLTVSEARRRVPQHLVARTIGALTAMFALGQVIGPLLAGFLAGSQGEFGPALLVAAGGVALGAVLIIAAGKAFASA